MGITGSQRSWENAQGNNTTVKCLSHALQMQIPGWLGVICRLQIFWHPGMTQTSLGRQQAPARVFATLFCLPQPCPLFPDHTAQEVRQERGSCY